MDIKATADRTARYCATRNPFDAAKSLGIIVSYESLSSVRGYYSKARRQKFIHINADLPEYRQKFVCAHELGHAIMHPDANTPFLRSNTLLSVNRLEIEANQFAACFLLSDRELREYLEYGYTIGQIAMCSGLPESLVQYRAKTSVFENKNYV